MTKPVPVSEKGKVVIADANSKIRTAPSQSMEESFGAGGDAMLDAAREISKERNREVRSERR